MKYLSFAHNYFWSWPDGLVWKLSAGSTYRSRKRKYDLFMRVIQPLGSESILDVGVNRQVIRYINFLEHWYPYPDKITAFTIDKEVDFTEFRHVFPKVRLMFGDGRSLPFPDGSFDIVFSNAVVEHVGDFMKQKAFIHELVRVGRRIFVTTPNYFFPIDSHTLIPFAHYLPNRVRFMIYKSFGRAYYADKDHLNLITPQQFLSLFPQGVKVHLYQQKWFGLPSQLIGAVTK